jgi:hypothetical protein
LRIDDFTVICQHGFIFIVTPITDLVQPSFL